MRTFLEHLLSFYIGETTSTNKEKIKKNISNVENYITHGKQTKLIKTFSSLYMNSFCAGVGWEWLLMFNLV